MSRYGALAVEGLVGSNYFATNAAARVLGNICAPTEFKTERLADQYSCQATATAELMENYRLNWNQVNQAVSDIDLDPSTMAIFQFRDPLRHTVMYQAVADLDGDGEHNTLFFNTYIAAYVDTAVSAISGTTAFVLASNISTCLTDAAHWFNDAAAPGLPDVNAVAGTNFPTLVGGTWPGTSWAPHGPYCYSGYHKDLSGVYVDVPAIGRTEHLSAGFIVSAGAIQNGASYGEDDTFEFEIMYYNGGDWQIHSLVQVPAAASETIWLPLYYPTMPNGSRVQSGYYAVKLHIRSVAAVEQLFGIRMISSAKSSFGHQALNNLSPAEAYGLGVNSIRMIGLDFLIKNVASPLNQQGSIVQVQAESCQDWFHTYVKGNGSSIGGPGSGFFNYVFNQATEKDMRLANGMDSWIKPNGFESFKWIQNISYGPPVGIPTSMQFELCTSHDFNVVAAETNNNAGGDCLIKFGNTIEYKTLNMWLDKQQSTSMPQDWEAALEAAKSMKTTFENPNHLVSLFSAILSTVGKYSRLSQPTLARLPGIGKVLGKVAGGVSKAAYFGAGVADDINEIMDDYKEGRKEVQAAVQKFENARKRKI